MVESPAETRRRRFWCALVIAAALLVLAGVVLLIRSDLGDAEAARASLSWPSTPGVVLSSKYVPESGSRHNHQPCQADIRFSYEVGSRTFRGSRFSRGELSCRELEQAVWLHREGMKVRVFYDPYDASDAILEPRERGTHWFLDSVIALLFGPLALLAIVVAVFIGWIPPPNKTRQLVRADERKRAKKKAAKARDKRRKQHANSRPESGGSTS